MITTSRKRRVRLVIRMLVAAACIFAAGVAMAQSAVGQVRYAVEIKPQELSSALKTFAKESGLHLVYLAEDVRALRTKGAFGKLTRDEALTRLLSGTGLTYRYLDASTAYIVPMSAEVDSPNQGHSDSPGSSSPPGSQRPTGSDEHWVDHLEEIVVTATKLQQPARSQSSSVSVVSGAQLDAEGAQSFQDYLTRLPGVVFNASVPGLSSVVIRGVSTTNSLDQGQGTTGYYINEVPLTDPNFAVAIPDIDTFDVENVAVLRGPQGTLFGSGSLGGAINYQAALPDLSAFHVRVQTTFAGTSEGAPSNAGKLMVNVPLIDNQLGIRGVYIYRNDGGYIDNIGTGVKNSNSTLVHGLRGELLWAPHQGTKISYLFLTQTESTADNGYSEPNLAGPLQKTTVISEPLTFKTTINNLRLDQNVGFATLTATATYHQKRQFSNTDLTLAFGPLFGNQLSPISSPQQAYANGTTFEVRLTSPADQRFTYVVGVMRDGTREHFFDQFGAPGAEQYATAVFDPLFGAGFGAQSAANNIFENFTLAASGDERAMFGEGTFHLNRQWAITLGGRYFDTKVTGATSTAGLLEFLSTNPATLSFSYSSSERSRGFTPKASITWNATSDTMAYVLASKGFRFGGPNLNPPDPADPFPPTYAPDSLWNYELGMRTNWLNRRLEWDSTAFYIDWSNIQVRLGTASDLAYATNFGKAVNYGIENSFVWRPTSSVTVQGNITYLDATLRQEIKFGQTDAPAGSVLPGASRWNLSGSVAYKLDFLPFKPSLLLSDRYISSAPGNFGQAAPVTQFGYNLLDARLSAYIKNADATLFVNNIADRRGASSVNYYAGNPFEQYIVRPRTVGITVNYRY